MRIGDGCVDCIYNREVRRTSDEAYLRAVRKILEEWDPKVSAPYYEYMTNKMYAERIGAVESYAEIKKEYNELVLADIEDIRSIIRADRDPLKKALFMARIGNFIDFAAMKSVDKEDFLKLLFDFKISPEDEKAYLSFVDSCEKAGNFLLLADNAGEIVLDRLFLEEMKKRFPGLELNVMVRGGEVSNDATAEDAEAAGIGEVARVISSGIPVAGVIYEMITDEAKRALDSADVILSKGQGNFEALSGQGRHAFYSFLCKCDMFMLHFGVPRYTGMLIEESAD